MQTDATSANDAANVDSSSAVIIRRASDSCFSSSARAVGTVGRDSAPLLVLDSTGQHAGQLGLWAGRERGRLDLRGEPSRLPLRFGRTTVYDGRNGMAVIGPTDSLDLAVFDDARLVLRMAARHQPVQPTAQAIADWERSVRLEAPGLGDLYLEALARAPTVPALPTIGAVVIEASGNVWVGSYSAQQGAPRIWRVFSRRGEPLGRLELPTLSPLLMPGSPELLDVFGDRLAVRRVTAAGETIVEVRAIVAP